MTMDRAATIKSYLQAGKSVCPFAKDCPFELAAVGTSPRADRADILRSATAFAKSRGNAIILLANADQGFAATATWAAEAFLELLICCVQISQPEIPIADIEDHVERIIRPSLSSTVIRPHISVGTNALMTICMAPVYPAAHPRYAPHTILVSTWSADVQTVGAVPKIQAAMAKAHGHVYDANELTLPLPAAKTTKLKMWIGNFDGRRQGLVIAPTKQRAIEVAGVGRTDFNAYWHEVSPIPTDLEPEVFYTRPFADSLRDGKAVWRRGRCPV